MAIVRNFDDIEMMGMRPAGSNPSLAAAGTDDA
jgi:hypothetical protein